MFTVPLNTVSDFHVDPNKPLTSTTASFTWSHVTIDPEFLQGFFTAYKVSHMLLTFENI